MAYTVTVNAGGTNERFAGDWYVIHQVLYDGAYVANHKCWIEILDGCSQLEVKSLTTINGEVISDYAHMPSNVELSSLTVANSYTTYLTEMVLAFPDSSLFDITVEYTWSSSSPGSMSANWPCPVSVPHLYATSIKPEPDDILMSPPYETA